MSRRDALVLGATVAVAAGVLAVAAAGGTAASGAAPRLTAYASCDAFLGHVKRQARAHVGPYGLGGGVIGLPSAADGAARGQATPVAGVDYSATNVQEEGVDEPDLVKSNGSHVFVARADRLFAVDVRGRSPRLVGSLALTQGWSHELLLSGRTLFVLSQGSPGPLPVDGPTVGVRSSILPFPPQTVLTEVDASSPARLAVVRSVVLDARYLSARLVGTSARIVTTSGLPGHIRFEPPTDGSREGLAAAEKRNRQILAASKIGSWLPRYAVRGRRGETLLRRPLVSCTDVRRPARFSGLGLVTVLTIDLRKGLAPVDTDAVVADGQTVYASQRSLYVATQRWQPQPANPTADPPSVTTAIHRFDIADPLRTHYRSSGSVSGYVLDQWALSEHRGVLRVATTEEPIWWNPGPRVESESAVTTLAERGGELVRLGRVGGLGKGERVYSVRFQGAVGYVVTFRQIDPLYTLWLANPARPAVLGELKITGYSAYLHPLGGDLLLGVGRDATPEGRVLGTQVSLFDVSNVRRPARLDAWTLGPSASEVEWDHHAFLWWPKDDLAVLPVTGYELAGERGVPFTGALALRVTRGGGIRELGRVVHDGRPRGEGAPERLGAAIRRSLVVGPTLYTVSDAGVQASALPGLGEVGWTGFPAAG
jgi:hypothetical protein